MNSVTNATKVTWYLGEYQYEEVVGGTSPKAFAVEFISFGEGRIRPITPRNESNTYDALQLDGNLTLPNGKKGSIDYFISDHRTDVRMILTEEKQWSYTTASMETASSRNTVEEGLFSTQVNLSRAPKTEVPGWTANTSQYVSKLNNTRPVGPNQLLKVMAGDLLHANVQYYYQQVATNSSGSTVFSSVLSMLGSSITGSAVTSAATKAASTSIIANLNTGLPFSQVISPDITSSTGNLPKAYLNVVFFDERFNFVSESSTSVRVGAANVAANLALTQIKAPENGYCYVYISNESTVSVYFDNLQVRHDRGRIVEENHYYAYGLRINAISSKAYGGPANNYLYQGDFAELDEDLGWTDFMLRSYDAEIGRFLQNDPYDQFTSGYVGMGGDPANSIDPTGGIVPSGPGCSCLSTAFSLGNLFGDFGKTYSTISSIISLATTVNNVFSKLDPLSRGSLQNNPDFTSLSLGDLRGMVKDENSSLEQYQVNISAGLLLEDLYIEFSGFEKNTQSRYVIGPNPFGLLPLYRTIIPDILVDSEIINGPIFRDGGVIEIKAINEPINFSTSRYQVAAEVALVKNALPYAEGKIDYKRKNAGESKAAAITFVLPADRSVDPEFVRELSKLGVNVFVSYAYRNIKTNRIVFSTPERLNYVNKNLIHPKVSSNYSGVSPNVEKVTNRWRILEKQKIDE